MSRSWLRNARGEWFLIVQAALMLAVFFAPKLDALFGAPSPSRSEFSLIAGTLLGIAGLGFVLLGSAALGRNLSPFPKPKESATLIENGVFSVVRHPIYTGFSLCALGWTVARGSGAALISAVVLMVFFDVKARREERWLEGKFASYRAYKGRVKKLIPFVY